MKKDNESHILILWEDLKNRDSLATYLRMQKLSVSQTGDGLQGISMLEKQGPSDPYCLVFLGPHLRSLESWELIPLIRGRYSKERLPLLALHPNASDKDIQEYLDMGVNGIVRQIDNHAIFRRITTLLFERGEV